MPILQLVGTNLNICLIIENKWILLHRKIMQEKLNWTIWHKSLSQSVPNTAIWKCRGAGWAFKRKPIWILTHEGLINHRKAPICALNTLINTSRHIPYVSHCHLFNTFLSVIYVPACSYIKYIIACVFSLHRELTAWRMDGGVSFHRFKGHLALMRFNFSSPTSEQ